MSIHLYVGLSNNIDPKVPSTADCGFDIGFDEMFTIAFLMMRHNNKYNSFTRVCELKEQKEIKFTFVPCNWRGRETFYQSKQIFKFNPEKHKAVGCYRLGKAYVTGSKYKSMFEKTLNHAFKKEHPIWSTVAPLLSFLNDNKMSSNPKSELNNMIISLYKDYQQLKSRHHLNGNPQYHDISVVANTMISQAHLELDKLIGPTLKACKRKKQLTNA